MSYYRSSHLSVIVSFHFFSKRSQANANLFSVANQFVLVWIAFVKKKFFHSIIEAHLTAKDS